MKNIIECYGCLIKVENLWCLSELGIPNTCLLESLEAFPGYYGDVPKINVPKFVYFVLAEASSLEQVTRLTMQVKKHFPFTFDAAYSEITMRNQTCTAIRITNIEDYSLIKQLQETYQNLGFTMKKKIRNIENEPALIKIRKFFSLEVCPDGIYLDQKQKSISYFEIPKQISWEELKENISLLRNNWSGNRFDAALSFIYRNNAIKDMIRIYSKENNEDFTRALRDKYYSLMKL